MITVEARGNPGNRARQATVQRRSPRSPGTALRWSDHRHVCAESAPAQPPRAARMAAPSCVEPAASADEIAQVAHDLRLPTAAHSSSSPIGPATWRPRRDRSNSRPEQGPAQRPARARASPWRARCPKVSAPPTDAVPESRETRGTTRRRRRNARRCKDNSMPSIHGCAKATARAMPRGCGIAGVSSRRRSARPLAEIAALDSVLPLQDGVGRCVT